MWMAAFFVLDKLCFGVDLVAAVVVELTVVERPHFVGVFAGLHVAYGLGQLVYTGIHQVKLA